MRGREEDVPIRKKHKITPSIDYLQPRLGLNRKGHKKPDSGALGKPGVGEIFWERSIRPRTSMGGLKGYIMGAAEEKGGWGEV